MQGARADPWRCSVRTRGVVYSVASVTDLAFGYYAQRAQSGSRKNYNFLRILLTTMDPSTSYGTSPAGSIIIFHLPKTMDSSTYFEPSLATQNIVVFHELNRKRWIQAHTADPSLQLKALSSTCPSIQPSPSSALAGAACLNLPLFSTSPSLWASRYCRGRRGDRTVAVLAHVRA